MKKTKTVPKTKTQRTMEGKAQTGRCLMTADEQKQVFRSFFENKEPPRPLFVFVYGLPGAGKSSIIARFLRERHIPMSNVIRLIIDGIVDASLGFRAEIKAVDKEEKMAALTEETVDKAELEENFAARRRRIYARYREGAADFLFDTILDRAMLGRFHIVYETTGSNIGSKLMEMDQARRLGYRTVILYPFITPDISWKRIAERRKTTGEVGGASRDFIQNAFGAAQLSLINTWAQQVDEIIIYDNISAPSVDEAKMVFHYQRRISPSGETTVTAQCPQCESVLFRDAVPAFAQWLKVQCKECGFAVLGSPARSP